MPRNRNELEIAVEELTETLVGAYESSCPVVKIKGRQNPPWWTAELARLRMETRKAFNQAKRTGAWEDYRRLLTSYNHSIRNEKRRSFRNFCEEISETPVAARLHKALAKDQVETNTSLKRANGEYTENSEERAKLLLETHFPGSNQDHTLKCSETTRRPSRKDWKKAAEICTENRIIWAIKSFRPYKAAGVDGILSILMQKGIGKIAPI